MEAYSGLVVVVPEAAPGPVFAFFRHRGCPGRPVPPSLGLRAAGSVAQRAPRGKPAAMTAETARTATPSQSLSPQAMYAAAPRMDSRRAQKATAAAEGPGPFHLGAFLRPCAATIRCSCLSMGAVGVLAFRFRPVVQAYSGDSIRPPCRYQADEPSSPSIAGPPARWRAPCCIHTLAPPANTMAGPSSRWSHPPAS